MAYKNNNKNYQKDFSLASTTGYRAGICKFFKALVDHNRVGDILVLSGKISPNQLGHAMRDDEVAQQSKNIGQILVNRGLVTINELRFALFKQKLIRTAIALCTLFVSLSSVNVRSAKASGIKDVPAKIRLISASKTGSAIKLSAYPDLFGYSEKKSKELKAFTKWTGMFDRFENMLENKSSRQEMTKLQTQLTPLVGLSLSEQARKVHLMMNKVQYITDNKNWGKSDYWATPIEFMQRGGDCEDYAIAKYTALRMLGVGEDRLRIAIVQDTYKNIPHAVLIVYTEKGPMLLDNQTKTAVFTDTTRRYEPIFSINRNAWWLHKQPEPARVASLN